MRRVTLTSHSNLKKESSADWEPRATDLWHVSSLSAKRRGQGHIIPTRYFCACDDMAKSRPSLRLLHVGPHHACGSPALFRSHWTPLDPRLFALRIDHNFGIISSLDAVHVELHAGGRLRDETSGWEGTTGLGGGMREIWGDAELNWIADISVPADVEDAREAVALDAQWRFLLFLLIGPRLLSYLLVFVDLYF